jgi:hypothetical protein
VLSGATIPTREAFKTRPSPTRQRPRDRRRAPARCVPLLLPDRLVDGRRSPTHGPHCQLPSPSSYKSDIHGDVNPFSLPFFRRPPELLPPPVSHQLCPPFVDSSRIAHRRDLTVLLPLFCSSGFAPSTATLDHIAAIHQPPVSAYLRASHRRPRVQTIASCSLLSRVAEEPSRGAFFHFCVGLLPLHCLFPPRRRPRR